MDAADRGATETTGDHRSEEVVLETVALGFPWATLDPFLVAVHHVDPYPSGNEDMGPANTEGERPRDADPSTPGWSSDHRREGRSRPGHGGDSRGRSVRGRPAAARPPELVGLEAGGRGGHLAVRRRDDRRVDPPSHGVGRDGADPLRVRGLGRGRWTHTRGAARGRSPLRCAGRRGGRRRRCRCARPPRSADRRTGGDGRPVRDEHRGRGAAGRPGLPAHRVRRVALARGRPGAPAVGHTVRRGTRAAGPSIPSATRHQARRAVRRTLRRATTPPAGPPAAALS